MSKIFVALDYIGSMNKSYKLNTIVYVSETSKGVKKHEEGENWSLFDKYQVTSSQKNLIDAILNFDYEFFSKLSAYKEYEKNPSIESANRFIQMCNAYANFESNKNIEGKVTYIKYMKERRGVALHENIDHGLFDENGIADPEFHSEFARRPNVRMYRIVLSLNAEDAKEVNLNTLDQWMTFSKKVMPDILKVFDCNPNKTILWNGAFHSNQSQPHIHINVMTDDLNVYIHDDKNRSLSKIKSIFMRNIYPNLFERLKLERTEARNEFEGRFKEISKNIFNEESYQKIKNELNPLLERTLDSLSTYTGRLYYQYLPEIAKQGIQGIIFHLCQTEELNELLNEYVESIVDQQLVYKDEFHRDTGELQVDRDQIKKDIIFDNSKIRRHTLHNSVLQALAANRELVKKVVEENNKDSVSINQLLKNLSKPVIKMNQIEFIPDIPTVDLSSPIIDVGDINADIIPEIVVSGNNFVPKSPTYYLSKHVAYHLAKIIIGFSNNNRLQHFRNNQTFNQQLDDPSIIKKYIQR